MRVRTRLLWCLCLMSFALVSCGVFGESTSTTTTTTTTTTTSTTTTTATPPPPNGASTLDVVIGRGFLKCGVNEGLAGFTNIGENGEVSGFDPDFCRAIAAAVLGDSNKVEFVHLNADNRFDSLKTGEIDVLIRNTTWTSSRDAEFDFGPTTFHDSQRLMGRSDEFRASSPISELNGHTVCVTSGATAEDTLEELITEIGMVTEIKRVEAADDLIAGLRGGTCDAIMADGAALTGQKQQHEPVDGAWTIFPNHPISQEPLGPVYRSNDSKWADVVNWTVYAMIIADEMDITSNDVAYHLSTGDTEALLLLGDADGLAAQMHLEPDAFYNVIEQVGNYDEVFRSNLQPVGITRAGSLNAKVLDLGLITAPPIRAP